MVVYTHGRNRALDYARWLLDEAGVTVVADASPDEAGSPALIAGSGRRPAETAGYSVTIWDFQVGHAGTGLQAAAASGVAWVIGLPGRPPLGLPIEIPEKWAGLLGTSICLAYFAGPTSVDTARFDVSAADILHGFADQNNANHTQIVDGWRRNGRTSPEHGGIFPQGAFPCRDGYVGVVARSKRDWRVILEALGNPSWIRDDLLDPFELAEHPEEIERLLTEELSNWTRDDLLERALAHTATIAPVYGPDEARERNLVRPHFWRPDGSPSLPFGPDGVGQPAVAAAAGAAD